MASLTLPYRDTYCSQSPNYSSSSLSSMNIFRKLQSKSSSTSRRSSHRENTMNSKTSLSRSISNSTPFPQITPTRRPNMVDSAPPPAYTPPASNTVVPGAMQVSADSPYAFLAECDTIFLIDDSGSMAGRSWRETAAALSAITPICTEYDADGIDIYFLNHRNERTNSGLGGYTNVTTTAMVENIFNSVRPLGGTPTGTRLHQILKKYMTELEESMERVAHGHKPSVKPLNIIVITDGVPSDDVESVIVTAAKKLDSYEAEPWQVGVQFFQVGCEPEAAEDLRDLDDALSSAHGIRDMVDTVPWSGNESQTLSADFLLKVVLGSLLRRLDRKPVRK